MDTFTKAHLIQSLTESLDTTQEEARTLVEAFFVTVATQLEQGQSVKLRGFGRFDLRDKKPRMGRNPKNTSETHVIPARRVVTFTAGKRLNAALLENHSSLEAQLNES